MFLVRWSVLVVVVASAAACPKSAPLPAAEILKNDEALARLRASAAQRTSVAGVVKARLPGLQGVVMNADLDVAAEPDAKLVVAVRSFFEQPMQVLATDGTTVTLFDATQGEPLFFRGAASDRTVARVLGLPLPPKTAVHVFLGRPPVGDTTRARVIGADEDAGTVDISVQTPGDPSGAGPSTLTMRLADDVIVRFRAYKPDGRPLVDVRYDDFVDVGGVLFARRLSITLTTDRGETSSYELKAIDVVWNGPPLGPEAWTLEPPEGVPLRPL